MYTYNIGFIHPVRNLYRLDHSTPCATHLYTSIQKRPPLLVIWSPSHHPKSMLVIGDHHRIPTMVEHIEHIET